MCYPKPRAWKSNMNAGVNLSFWLKKGIIKTKALKSFSVSNVYCANTLTKPPKKQQECSRGSTNWNPETCRCKYVLWLGKIFAWTAGKCLSYNQSLKSVRINMQSPPQSRSCTVLSLVDSGIHQLTFISLPGRQLKDPMESNLTQPSLQPDSAAAGWPGWRCRDLWKLHPPPSGFCDFKMFWSLLQKSMYTTERVLYKHNFEVFFTLVAYFCYFILPHHNILRANNVLFTLLHLFNKFSY